MKTSIIIPSYNQQEFLPDAIESALKQDAEVIVIDDGSTDSSLEIANKYWKDGGVRVISQVNKGLSSARNTGIMAATGKYVLPLDADDILEDDAVKKLEAIMEKEDADMVAPSFKCFGLNNGEVILIKDPKLEDYRVGNRTGYLALFKRDVLLEVGGYSPRMTFGYEDMHLAIDLLTRGKKIVTTEEILWLYRTKERSMVHEAQEHHVELMNQIYKDFPNFNTDKEIKTPLPK